MLNVLRRLNCINFKERLICLLSCMFATHSAIEKTVHEVKVNYHCMLFGIIQEREKIFTEGFLPLCFTYLVTEYTLALFGLYLTVQVIKYPTFNW